MKADEGRYQKGGCSVVHNHNAESASDMSSLPLPLQAFTLAELPPLLVTPALVRAVEQWCEVLPLSTVAQGLRRVSDSASLLEDFRQEMLHALRYNVPQGDYPPPSTPHTNTLQNQAEPRPESAEGGQEQVASVSATVKQLVAKQDKLEAMSDAEYQAELVKRLQTTRNRHA